MGCDVMRVVGHVYSGLDRCVLDVVGHVFSVSHVGSVSRV